MRYSSAKNYIYILHESVGPIGKVLSPLGPEVPRLREPLGAGAVFLTVLDCHCSISVLIITLPYWVYLCTRHHCIELGLAM